MFFERCKGYYLLILLRHYSGENKLGQLLCLWQDLRDVWSCSWRVCVNQLGKTKCSNISAKLWEKLAIFWIAKLREKLSQFPLKSCTSSSLSLRALMRRHGPDDPNGMWHVNAATARDATAADAATGRNEFTGGENGGDANKHATSVGVIRMSITCLMQHIRWICCRCLCRTSKRTKSPKMIV